MHGAFLRLPFPWAQALQGSWCQIVTGSYTTVQTPLRSIMPLEEFSSFISCKLCDLRAAGMCDFAVYLQVWCEGRHCLRLVFFRPLSSLREGGSVLLDHLPAELAQCQLLFIQTEQTPALFRLPSLYNGSPITLPGRWAAHLPADMFTVLLLVSCKNAKACSRHHARGSLSELTP